MTIFGTVINLPHEAGTIVFIVVLIFLMIFEGGLHELETACTHRGLAGLVKKLYKEFMILGLISFAIFIVQELYKYDPHDEWFLSFEFAHIVMLFVGINFVVESFLLVALIEGRNKTLLRHDNSSSEQLLLEYLDMQKQGGIMQTLFNYGLVSIPVPELREKIEYKIIQEYFVRSYNLPAEFKFANYLCTLLKSFVFSLIEVRPISWFIIAALVVLNYARIKIIDPVYQSAVCEKYYTHFHHQVSHHYGEHVCQEYTLRYVFVCSMFLTVYLIGVFAASETYMQRLIGKVLDEEELLEQLEREEDMQDGFNAPSQANQVGFNNASALKKVDSDMSDLGGAVEDFNLELNTSHNATLKGSKKDDVNTLSTLTAASAGVNKTSSPPKVNRKVSYGDVNTITIPTAASDASIAEGASEKSTVSFGGISESLKYDLQSEDGESLMEKRQAAATKALSAVQTRKSGPVAGAATADGPAPERLLRRSISEFNVNKDVSSRRHLYSLCLQRIMLVEFEYLAHQSSKGNAPPPPAPAPKKALGGARASVFRRLGSAFFSATPAADEPADDVSRDLELATSNSFKNATSQVKAATLQTLAQNPAKTLSPQEYISGTNLSRRRSGFMNASMYNPSTAATAGESKKSVGGTSSKFAAVPTAESSVPATSPAAGQMRNDGKHSPQRTYSAHFFEMQAPPRKKGLSAAQRMASAFNIVVPDDSFCNRVWTKCTEVGAAIGHVMTKFWHLLIGLEEEENEETDEDIQYMQDDLSTIFVWKSPMLYFFTVEFALLVQCLYLSLWATNFIVIARDSYFPDLWEAALLVPVPLNFWLIQKIIFSACTLKAVVSLDRTVADKICEEALDARNVAERLRKIIRSTLAGLNFEKLKWNSFLYEQFHLFKKDGADGITEKQMRQFLHSLQIFLTDTSVSRIFNVIDFDRDGKVTWKDLSDIVFPELAQQQLKVNRKAGTGKSTKTGKSVKVGKNGSGKSNKSTVSATAEGPAKRYNFADDNSDASSEVSRGVMNIQSYRPSATLSGKGNVTANSALSVSGTFGLTSEDSKDDLAAEYTPTKKNARSKGLPEGVKFVDDSDESSDEEGRKGHESRYDAEDAEFGGRYINHRSISLRNKLSTVKREAAESQGPAEEVIYNEDADDFWTNASESPPPDVLSGSARNNNTTGTATAPKKSSFFPFL